MRYDPPAATRMQTPSPKFFCPRCRAAFEADTNFCGRCGADMRRASRLEYARVRSETSQRLEAQRPRRATTGGSGPPAEDRRAGSGRDRWLGRIVDHRYKVIEVLGRGGMGVVYKVEHQRMGKVAAMKVLHHDLADDPDVARRFRLEAEAVSRLTHPNTVQVFDFGAENAALYLVMEYVRGVDLGSLVDRDGPLEFARAAPILAQICAALEEAHELGVVHRDLKPENLLVTRTRGGHDFVKVLDFGLAKLSEREEAASVTGRGSIVGTPYYMSPEQIRGEDDIDGRADIYSFGALMYRVLTGEPVFSAKSPVGVLTKHLTEPPVPPSKLGAAALLDDIVLRCLEKQPGDRYRSIGAVLGDLEQAHAELVAATSGPLRTVPTSWLRSGRAAPALARELDYGIDESLLLQRSDLEGYERQLRRRRSLRLVAVPLLFAGAAAAALWLLALRPEAPQGGEVEPNDRLATATLIASGREVTGLLGQRISRDAPDADFFRLAERPAPEGSVVTAEVTALPNVDIELALYDDTGKLLARSDEGGVGEPEWLRRVRVSREVVVRVTESFEPGGDRLPTENVSDHYRLSVVLSDIDPRLETEPNDAGSDANRLAPGAPVTGHLDHRGDVDAFRFDGAAGRYRLLVSGGPELPFSWRREGGTWSDALSAEIELAPGDILSLRRDDDRGAAKAPAGGDAYTVDLSRID